MDVLLDERCNTVNNYIHGNKAYALAIGRWSHPICLLQKGHTDTEPISNNPSWSFFTAIHYIKWRMILAVVIAVVNPQLTCSQRQWLHSSVGRASHRYREVTGSSPVEVLNFFQASLRNCKNCDHNCEDHSSFDFISAVHIWFTSYASFIHYILKTDSTLLFITQIL